MTKLFETGWERKPRGADGKLIHEAPKAAVEPEKTEPVVKAKDGMETVKVTRTVDTGAKGEETGELAKMVTTTDGPVAGQVLLEGTRVPEI